VNFKNRLKKLILIPGILLGCSIFIVGIDILVSGSLYHPLTYLYSGLSWGICKYKSCQLSQKPFPVQSPQYHTIAVVTSQHRATEVGLQILGKGGNAVDAAVAVGYALAVTDPCCGNIGGGGFMLLRTAKGATSFINFREKAPLNSRSNMYQTKDGRVNSKLSTKGYLSVGVPGTVAGLDYALRKYGTVSLSTAMEPAITLASNGFVLEKGDVSILHAGTDQFKGQANVANIFLKKGTEEYQIGDVLVQKNLATTLANISKRGPREFYKGQVARKIVDASKLNNGILTLEDFKNYTVEETKPITCSYRGYEVITAPLPGGGVTLCQMLNIIEGYNLKELGFHSSSSLQYILSAMMFAYADRNNSLGDPDFVKNPTEKLLSKSYAQLLRQKIPKNKAPEILLNQNSSSEKTNTTHYSIQDKYGNSVSLTYTINGYFGSGSIAGDTGFFLNNEMDDFASAPNSPNSFGLIQGESNKIEPGKRPLSSMSPTIVLKDSKTFMITGSPGGSTIPTTVLQVLTNVIDFDMNIDTAVNAPRIHYQGIPNFVITEPYALKSNVFQKLWEMGFRVIPFPSWGAANSISIDSNQRLQFAFDRRKTAAIVKPK
jgi:gamma-glutamyltranspeptidase / glutathione hydrolase